MEEEINNLIMIGATVVISSCYCFAASKLVPKGLMRFLLFLPVFCLFFILPLYLKLLSFILPFSLFITWLTSFKLLLLVSDTGPLSSTGPSLSLLHFLLISCLPIKLPKPTSPTKENGAHTTLTKQNDQNSSGTLNIDLGYIIQYAIKGSIFIFLTMLGYFKHMLPQQLVAFLICIYVYLALEISLVACAVVAKIFLGIGVDVPFDHPYLSTSLQDFWGRRWNRVAASSLRTTIFVPVRNATERVLGRKSAAVVALVVTFIVSDLMHEIIFYYFGRVRFGGGIPTFFIFQGICVAIESTIKKNVEVKWRVPQKVFGPLIFGFQVGTFMWLALPDLLELRVDERVLQEYVEMGKFVIDLGLAWPKMGRPFWIQFART